MPTVTLNKTVFEKLVGKKLPLAELKDRISLLGTDLEKIEGEEIVVEVFPNRPDMLSEQGFARAFSSFIGVKTGLRLYPVKKSGEKIIVENSVREVRPYTACAIVKKISFSEEKIREVVQLQEKLHTTYGRNRKKVAIGLYPLEKITFPVRYKADKPGHIIFQPLGMEREMSAREILEEHQTGKEFAHLLAGCPKYPFFIDAKGEILSLPPIINSQRTGKVIPETKELFVECSGFDFPTLSICLNILVTTLAEMGGEIYSVQMEYGHEKKSTPDLTPGKMKLDLPYINKRLGLSLKDGEAIKLLARMGYGHEKNWVLIPSYRADILHQVDLMEDIAIAYGYENFRAEIPQVSTIGEEASLEKFSRKVREIFAGLGMLEAKNYHLLMKEELREKMALKDEAGEEAIPLKNALGDYNHLRDSLLPSLLKNLRDNQHQGYPQQLFEIGRVFAFSPKTETGVKETEKLSLVIAHEKADFTEIKQAVEALLLSLGGESRIKESLHPSFMPGRAGKIIFQGQEVGILGEVHPQVLVNWGLTVPVVAGELELEKVWGLVR